MHQWLFKVKGGHGRTLWTRQRKMLPTRHRGSHRKKIHHDWVSLLSLCLVKRAQFLEGILLIWLCGGHGRTLWTRQRKMLPTGHRGSHRKKIHHDWVSLLSLCLVKRAQFLEGILLIWLCGRTPLRSRRLPTACFLNRHPPSPPLHPAR